MMKKNMAPEPNLYQKNSVSKKAGTFYFVLLYVSLVVFFTYWAIDRSYKINLKQLEENFLVTIQTVNGSVELWLDKQESIVLQEANEPELLQLTELLINSAVDRESMLANPYLPEFRVHFESYLEQTGALDIMLVNPDLITVASLRDNDIGNLNPINVLIPGFIERSFREDTFLSSSVSLNNAIDNPTHQSPYLHPTMYMVAPIHNENNEVIAAMLVELDPLDDLNEITKLSQIGISAGMYAIDQDGHLLTDSQFISQLIGLGLIKEDESLSHHIRVADPGGDTTKGYKSTSDRADLPLTLAATQVINGAQGSDFSGYRDYRGVSVVGSWIWNEDLGIGLIYEMERDEALASFYQTRSALLILIGATLFSTFLLGNRLLSNRRAHIAELKKANDALIESNQLNKAILENIVDGIITIDENGLITSLNPSAELIFGYTAAEMIGKNVGSLIPDPFIQQYVATKMLQDSEIQQSPIGMNREAVGIHKDGHPFPIYLGISEFINGDRKSYTALVRDITVQKQNEKTLRDTKMAAEASSLTKSQFLSRISHELRTPLNAIIGSIYLTRQTKLTNEQVKLLDKIGNSTNNLKNIIDAILQFNQMRKGELEIRSFDFNIRQLLQAIHQQMTACADKKGIKTFTYIDPQLPEYVLGDSERIKNVLDQLINNACKFTKAGEISISTRVINLRKENVQLQFEVRDTGIGMTSDQIQMIFQPFMQIDNTINREFEGMGMGLVDCKELIELMGGELWVESRQGKGSRFFFTLSFGIPSPAKIAEDSESLPLKTNKSSRKPKLVNESFLPDFQLDEIKSLLLLLQENLKKSDSKALEVITELKRKYPELNLLQRFEDLETIIAQYDFENALKALEYLANDIHISMNGD